jgi:hypothetical protein
MAFSLSYPRCYASDSWYSMSQACGGNSKQWQHFVKFSSDGELQEITGWQGNTPTAGHWQGPPNPDWMPAPSLPVPVDQGAGFWDNLKLFFEAGNKATNAAKVVGYATIAVVGGGLLLWYVPRTKR